MTVGVAERAAEDEASRGTFLYVLGRSCWSNVEGRREREGEAGCGLVDYIAVGSFSYEANLRKGRCLERMVPAVAHTFVLSNWLPSN